MLLQVMLPDAFYFVTGWLALLAREDGRLAVQCTAVHRGAFCQFPFRWIYYCHSSKSTGKETGKKHICAVDVFLQTTARFLVSHSMNEMTLSATGGNT